jgi:outer membrane protein OmpA-like peptidoglycan-associated protein
MRQIKNGIVAVMALSILAAGCKSMNRTQKGAVIGTAGGAAVGAVIGKAAGNTALGAILGATVGGVTGAVIGKKMDKQAEEIKKQVPDAKVDRVGEGIVVEFSDKILFGFNRSDLSSQAGQSLNKLVTVLNKYPDTNIEVQGHTDSIGSDTYNMTLSEKRAGTVANYLQAKGIAGNRITTKGFGKTAPVASNDTEEGRAQNRRVNFLITANDKMVQDAKKESGQ